MTERYAHYKALKFARPRPRVLEVVMSNPGKLNALDQDGHREIPEVWRDIDRDPDTSSRGAARRGRRVLGRRRSLDDQGACTRDWNCARACGARRATSSTTSSIARSRSCRAIEGPCVGAGLAAAMIPDITVAGRKARIIDGHTRLGVAAGDHAAIIWPLLVGMAKAKYYLMLCDTLTGEEAERIGLVSLVADDDKVVETALGIARAAGAGPLGDPLDEMSLNNWLRQAGPTFDASLAMEFMGFSGPEVKEGHDGADGEAATEIRPQGPVLIKV